jgi:DNA-binding response OmpR family regulator
MARILIVEDDQPFAEALALAIEPAGHHVLVAGSAEEGIRLGLAHNPDVVIADWMLGGDLHGGDVCRRIRDACPPVKTILMTGYLGDASGANRWSEYAEILMRKPFHQEAILEALNSALRTSVPCNKAITRSRRASAPA